MRYELLLQSLEPRGPFDPVALERALDAHGAVLQPDGSRKWTVENTALELRRVLETGQCIALELGVPLSDKPDGVRLALQRASELATETAARLFDPQLGRGVSAADEDTVIDRFTTMSRYAGEVLGASEAMTMVDTSNDPVLSPGAKVLLGVFAFIGLGLWLLSRIG